MTATTDDDAPAEYARRMVDELTDRGMLRTPAWQQILREVPRHLFVPGHDVGEAYTTAVTTQTRTTDTRRDADGEACALPTSSLSAPSAVAVALEALDIRGGERVLEIGTGTGYVAALLSTRLGDEHVVSVDLDPDLVAAATGRLDRLGLHPALHSGDGYHALAEHAPYDRIVATCAVSHIPPAWIQQLAPGGRLVAPAEGPVGSPVVVADKTADDEVTGRLLLDGGGFMPLRGDADSPLAADDERRHSARPEPIPYVGTTTLDPVRITGRDRGLGLFCYVHLPGWQAIAHDDTLLVRRRGDTATVTLAPGPDGRWPVEQTARRLWDTVETAVALWDHLGHPAPDRFGITALDRPHRQYLWLDDPDGPYAWPLDPGV